MYHNSVTCRPILAYSWNKERLSIKRTPGFLASINRIYTEMRQGSRYFLPRVYLVPRLLVPETACGFCRFEFNIATSRLFFSYWGYFRTKKEGTRAYGYPLQVDWT